MDERKENDEWDIFAGSVGHFESGAGGRAGGGLRAASPPSQRNGAAVS